MTAGAVAAGSVVAVAGSSAGGAPSAGSGFGFAPRRTTFGSER